jgi:hypothetical protein
VKNPNRLPGDAEQTTADTPKVDQPVVQEGPKANSAGSRTARPGTERDGAPSGGAPPVSRIPSAAPAAEDKSAAAVAKTHAPARGVDEGCRPNDPEYPWLDDRVTAEQAELGTDGPGPRASGVDDNSPRHVATSGAIPGPMPGALPAPEPGRGGTRVTAPHLPTAAMPSLTDGGADGPAAGPEVRAEPPAADPGDRLPATLEGWQARFPELGPMRFGAWQNVLTGRAPTDVLTGRAPTDVLTPRERSEFGLGLVRFFIYGYEPAPEDPDGEVLAILDAVGPYLAGVDAKAWPMLAFDAAMGPHLASEDDDAPRSRPRRRLGRWTPVRGYKVPYGTPAQVQWARGLKADRWGGLVNALHAELDEPEAALSRFVDTIKKGFPPEAAKIRRDLELALALEMLDEQDAKFWIELPRGRDDFVVRQAWSETMSRIGRRYKTPASWRAQIERCQRGLPESPEDRAEPDTPPEMKRRRILRALAVYPAGETERGIARRIGSTPTETKQFLDQMVARGEVEVVTVARPRGKKQAPGGYRLVGPASAPVGGGGGGEGEPHDHGGGSGGS